MGDTWKATAAAVLCGIGAWVAVAATDPRYGLTIDEGTTFWVADEEIDWLARFRDTGLAALAPERIAAKLHYLEEPGSRPGAIHSNLNLPLTEHLMVASRLLWQATGADGNRPAAYRWGHWTLFAATVAAVTWSFGRRRGRAVGVAAGVLLLCNPRVFGHAHLAVTETPQGCLWTLALLALHRATSRTRDGQRLPATWAGAVAVALVVGLLLATKLTGWTIGLPVAVWLLALRPPGWWKVALLCATLSPAVVVALTPNLWHDPIGTFAQHLRFAAGNPWRIPSFYRHRGYLGDQPAASTFVILGSTMPLTTLVLGLVGAASARHDRFAALLALNAATLPLLRLSGLLPHHDGERLMIATYYLWPLLAALGLGALLRWARTRNPRRRRGPAAMRDGAAAVGDGAAAVGDGAAAMRDGAGAPASPAVTGPAEAPPAGTRKPARESSRWRCGFLALLLAATVAEPVVETVRFRRYGLSYYNAAIGGLPGARAAGMELTYWFEPATEKVLRDWLGDLPPGSRVFLRPEFPGVERWRRLGWWPADVRAVGPGEADFMLLAAKRAAYLTDMRDGEAGESTDLFRRMQHDRPYRQREMVHDGVRLLVLLDVRGR